MSVSIKSEREISLMRESGRQLAVLHTELAGMICPGVSTFEIDRKGEEIVRSFGSIPSFLNYDGYPASICVSVNEEIVHGIPDKKRRLKEGDIVSLDAGILYKGYHSDAARTYGVGQVSPEAERLMAVSRECFFEALKVCKAGNHLYDISAAIDDRASAAGYAIFHELCGHGVGSKLHEDPQVPNYRQKTKGIRLRPGMILAIEPMIGAGGRTIQVQDDRWTIITADHSLASHYENTVLITDGEPEILTIN